MDAPEHAIYRAAIQGDREAFETVIRSVSRNLFAIAYGILQNREEAEDVVQDTFVIALEQLHTNNHSAKFGGGRVSSHRPRAPREARHVRHHPLCVQRDWHRRHLHPAGDQYIQGLRGLKLAVGDGALARKAPARDR